MEADPAVWINELRASQRRLAELVGGLGPAELRRPSYASEWTVAQLLSHIGSGAEITRKRLAGALALEREDAEKIWARWNALSPEQQAAEMLEADRACVEDLQRPRRAGPARTAGATPWGRVL